MRQLPDPQLGDIVSVTLFAQETPLPITFRVTEIPCPNVGKIRILKGRRSDDEVPQILTRPARTAFLLDLYIKQSYTLTTIAKEVLNMPKGLKESIKQINTRVPVCARVPERLKTRWSTAASLTGQTLTDFIIVAANTAADQIFVAQEKIILSERDQLKLAEMLLNPPPASPTMKKALKARLAELDAQ